MIMNTMPAQEIKRRGITAVDDLIAKGDVHVIKNNRPQYVVLSEERYHALMTQVKEAYELRVRASLEDLKRGRVQKFATVDDLLTMLEADETT